MDKPLEINAGAAAPIDPKPAPQAAPNLKPCPFCGENAETDLMRGFVNYKGKSSNAVAVYCSKCPADFTLCHEDYPGDPPKYLLSVLVECWNRRTPAPIPAPNCGCDSNESHPCDHMPGRGVPVPLIAAAAELIDFDPENQCPVCHCCGMELSGDGGGHRQNCLARLILDYGKTTTTPAPKFQTPEQVIGNI